VLLRFDAKERNLNSVKDIASDPDLLDAAAAKMVEIGGIVARMGLYMLGLKRAEKEFASIQILHIAPEFREAHQGLLRCLTTTLIRVLGGEEAEGGSEVLFLFDEASALGQQLPALKEVLERGRSAGARLLLAFQSDSQVQAAFKNQPTLIYDNTSTQIYVGASSLETAQRISSMLGSATVHAESGNKGTSESWQAGAVDPNTGGVQKSRSEGTSWAPHERPLLRPEEILTLDPNLLICFQRGTAPILARRVKYYADPAFGNAPECHTGRPLVWWGLITLALTLIGAALSAP
jgi:type IV secretory pathway TraG/TraD family ATPase VirD4